MNFSLSFTTSVREVPQLKWKDKHCCVKTNTKKRELILVVIKYQIVIQNWCVIVIYLAKDFT